MTFQFQTVFRLWLSAVLLVVCGMMPAWAQDEAPLTLKAEPVLKHEDKHQHPASTTAGPEPALSLNFSSTLSMHGTRPDRWGGINFRGLIYSIAAGSAMIAAALGMSFALVGAVQLSTRFKSGWLQYCFYAFFLGIAVITLYSDRDLSKIVDLPVSAEAPGRHPIDTWTQRGVSVFLLLASGERIARAWFGQKKDRHSPLLLLPAYILFWCATVAIPALLSAHPNISHEYLYPLLIGCAAILFSSKEADQAVVVARNAILIFIVMSLLMIPLSSHLVLETTYGQGLIPGLPRLAGLAPHAVSLGLLVQTGLLCLWAHALPQRWLNRTAWALGMVAFFLAQSKSSWLSFAVCASALAYIRYGESFNRRFFDPQRPAFGMTVLSGFMLGVILFASVVLFTDVGGTLSNFSDSSEGAQLMSLTGRDKIWAIAFQEWVQHPVFGYGPDLFSDAYRASIGMSFATHAHNQFMDTLARSGLVGVVALVVYVILLLVLSLRHARASGGLTLALFLTIALRGVSEVPLALFAYGPDFVVHVLLLMVLAGSARHGHVHPARCTSRHLAIRFNT